MGDAIDSLISWLKSYLSSKRQFVCVNCASENTDCMGYTAFFDLTSLFTNSNISNFS